MNNRFNAVYDQFYRTSGKNGQMIKLVFVLYQNLTGGYKRFFCVNARAEMVFDH
jgi:hypothetical protein